jgi:hypothetical protein
VDFGGCTHEISKANIADEICKSEGKAKVLFATVAFGLGNCIRSLKQVLVYDLPKWPTALMQMIGWCSRKNEKVSRAFLCSLIIAVGVSFIFYCDVVYQSYDRTSPTNYLTKNRPMVKKGKYLELTNTNFLPEFVLRLV